MQEGSTAWGVPTSHTRHISSPALYYITQWYIIQSSMRRIFIQTSTFERRVDERGADELSRQIERLILENPEEGAVISGTGGIRKMRVEDPRRGKGKRGGFRVLYLDLPDRERIYSITLYDKGEKADISPDEKRVLRELVKTLKQTGARK